MLGELREALRAMRREGMGGRLESYVVDEAWLWEVVGSGVYRPPTQQEMVRLVG